MLAEASRYCSWNIHDSTYMIIPSIPPIDTAHSHHPFPRRHWKHQRHQCRNHVSKLRGKCAHGVSVMFSHGLMDRTYSHTEHTCGDTLCTDSCVPYSSAYYPPHRHSGLTTHLVLRGEMTISYPDDAQPVKTTFGPGSRLDVDAGRRHEVWMGPQGATYVIGE